MKDLRWLALLGLGAALVGTPLRAQTGASNHMMVSASVRLRAEAWNWFDTPTQDGQYVFGAALARVGLSQQLSKLSWRVELAAPVLVGLPDNAVAPPPAGQLGLGASYWVANDSAQNVASVFLKQAFVRVGAAPGKEGAWLRAGRFEFIEGTETTPADPTVAAVKRDRIAHRLIGNFGFSHVQRSADGVHAAFDGKRVNVTAAVFRPTKGVFDVDGWGDLNIPVAYVSVNSRGAKMSDWRVFAIGYNDRRDPALLKIDNRSVVARVLDTDQIKLLTLGAHYLEAVDVGFGTVDILAWGAYQVGDWGLLRQRAGAYSIETGIQAKPTTPLRPWLRIGGTSASGDDNNSDDKHGTFFQLLPTPRIYARFPFYNMMNTDDGFVSLTLRPTAQLSLRADAHTLRLHSASDLWYGGGGAFEKETFGFSGRPSNGSHDLASLFDISADLRPSTHLTVSGYFGYARGGQVVSAIYPTGSNASLGYLELEWRR